MKQYIILNQCHKAILGNDRNFTCPFTWMMRGLQKTRSLQNFAQIEFVLYACLNAFYRINNYHQLCPPYGSMLTILKIADFTKVLCRNESIIWTVWILYYSLWYCPNLAYCLKSKYIINKGGHRIFSAHHQRFCESNLSLLVLGSPNNFQKLERDI